MQRGRRAGCCCAGCVRWAVLCNIYGLAVTMSCRGAIQGRQGGESGGVLLAPAVICRGCGWCRLESLVFTGVWPHALGKPGLVSVDQVGSVADRGFTRWRPGDLERMLGLWALGETEVMCSETVLNKSCPCSKNSNRGRPSPPPQTQKLISCDDVCLPCRYGQYEGGRISGLISPEGPSDHLLTGVEPALIWLRPSRKFHLSTTPDHREFPARQNLRSSSNGSPPSWALLSRSHRPWTDRQHPPACLL